MVKNSLRLSNSNVFGGGVTSKSLVIAALTGLATFGASNSAQASETPVTPTLGENSAYTLDANIQNSNNVITKYTYDNTGITGTVDYEVKLNQNTYGTGNAQKYFKWQSTEDGIRLVETDKTNAQVTANYSNDNLINDVINIPSYEDNSIPSEISGNFVGIDDYNLISIQPNYSNDGENVSVIVNSITADFVNNTASTSLIPAYSSFLDPVPIKINSISGDIISNNSAFILVHGAGDSYQNLTIESLSVNYINNSGPLVDIRFSAGREHGNYVSTIGHIAGNFIGNTNGVICNNVSTFLGSGVFSSTIGDITGNFIGNTSTFNGGAIYNYGDLADSVSIGNVTGDFIANSVINKSADTTITVYGGAIYNGGNDAHIESVTGDFIGNYAYSESGSGDIANTRAVGGAIYNTAKINTLTGNFISNYVKSTGKASGGAMHHSGTIDNFNVDYFINNKAESTQGMALGGALYSSNKLGELSTLTSDFVKNTAIGHTEAYGGAIFSNGLSTVNANFIENSVINNNTDASSLAAGGALANGAVTGVSSILSSADDADGIAALILALVGGIPPETGDIQGNYINNYAKANGGDAVGGAISNIGLRAYMQSVNANLQGNYASSITGNAMGGALYSTGYIGSVAGNFVNNYVSSQSGNAMGGAVYSDIITYGVPLKQVQDISNFYMLASEGSIIHVKVKETGQVVTLYSKEMKESIAEIDASGMYVTNSFSIDSIPPEEISLEEEGLTEAEFNAQIQDMIASGDYVLDPMEGVKVAPIIPGNLIYKNALFVNNRAVSVDGNAYGGAIYTKNNIALPNDSVMVLNITDADGNVIKTLYATSGNHSKEDLEAGAGANFTLAEPMTVTLEEYMAGYEGCTTIEETIAVSAADGTNILEVNPVDYNDDGVVSGLVNSSFIGNHAESTNGEAKGGAIYTTANLNIVADNGVVEFTDNYTLSNGVKDDNAIYLDNSESILNLNILNKGTVILNDNIDGQKGYNVNISGDSTGVLHLYNDIHNADVSIGNVTVNTLNNLAHTYNFNSLTVLNDTNVSVDVDLANKTMDRFTASEYGSHSGNLNVVGMNLLSDANELTTEIMFAEQGLKDNVTYGGAELPHSEHQTTLYTPIYKYNVAYDNRDDAGYFVFTRPTSGGSGGGSTTPSTPSVEAFNPAVLGGSTSATVGATATMNNTFNYAFQSSSDYMNIPYLERVSMKNRNKYALSVTGDATDMGRFSPLYQPSDEEASVWVKPYATFETVGLKNGPKVHNNTYGTLIGFDTEMKSIKNGWDRVFTGYIGYNGASQRYAGVDSTQNGGLLGGTMTLYKGNFFNATTVSVGASVANNQTMYGSEDFAMLLSGIGNKTGYNFEFKEGKLILQPSMLMSYTFVNTFDYTNAAGVRIDNKPLHALQLAPGVKVIGNLKNGWQPYASVQMVWNLMGESDATANGVKLPEMSIKPYVQYGVGLQKRIKDHFTAYGQAMIQNGGRNGVSLTAGFRWALGHDKCKYKDQKVDKSDKLDKSDKCVKSVKGHYEEQSDVVISSNNAIVARNDSGKSICHSELDSESINAGKTLTPALSLGEGVKKEILRSAQNDRPERKILKQLSPEQKMALGGKYYNTSRTAKTGSLRQY